MLLDEVQLARALVDSAHQCNVCATLLQAAHTVLFPFDRDGDDDLVEAVTAKSRWGVNKLDYAAQFLFA